MQQIMMHCHRFTLNGSFCVLIYARIYNIFAILALGSNSDIKKGLIVIFGELLGGTAKFGGVKNENIPFFSDWLVPIFPFPQILHFCSFRPAGALFPVPKLVHQIGGLCLSTTVLLTNS
jgi:hypothetical protein